jgi:UDP-3-O-acyl-N-acetylglucosamine deacetylase
MRDVEKLWSAGFALGASLENTVAIGDDGIMNPEGLRYADEFVRHKLLDAVGDLSLAGLPLLGTYRSYCGGHRMNFSVLEALFSQRSNYAIVDAVPRRGLCRYRQRGGFSSRPRDALRRLPADRYFRYRQQAPIGRMISCRLS